MSRSRSRARRGTIEEGSYGDKQGSGEQDSKAERSLYTWAFRGHNGQAEEGI